MRVQIESLQRFMPQLLHVRQPGMAAAGAGAPNLGSARRPTSYVAM